MKKMILLSLALVSGYVIAGLNPGNAESQLKVNTSKSVLKWIGEKVTGSHNGTVQIKEGTVTVSNGLIKTASVVVDMNTIVDEDIENPEYNAKLVGHLKSDDFFGVAKHPYVTFNLSSFTPQKGEGTNYLVKGLLTIKGITHEISFPASADVRDGFVRVKADLTFDRAKYDIRYNSGSFFDDLGDYMIYDDVKISFELFAAAE